MLKPNKNPNADCMKKIKICLGCTVHCRYILFDFILALSKFCLLIGKYKRAKAKVAEMCTCSDNIG